MSYNIVELIQSILVWLTRKPCAPAPWSQTAWQNCDVYHCWPVYSFEKRTSRELSRVVDEKTRQLYGEKSTSVPPLISTCQAGEGHMYCIVLYCFVLFCSVLSLIHEIINDINGNKSEKLRSHLPPMWHQWKPVERVLPVASSTGMPELATGSKPVQALQLRKIWEKYGQNGKHNITQYYDLIGQD